MTPPILVFLAGPNGAGKSTFYEAYLASLGWYFVNADVMARTAGLAPEEAARAADAVRHELVDQRTSFVTETVFSDPVGAKLDFLRRALAAGYRVQLIFIGIPSVVLSDARVASRVAKGGHDVPAERLARRYAQSLENLKAAIQFVPDIQVYDNGSSTKPFQLVLAVRGGRLTRRADPLPDWLSLVEPHVPQR